MKITFCLFDKAENDLQHANGCLLRPFVLPSASVSGRAMSMDDWSMESGIGSNVAEGALVVVASSRRCNEEESEARVSKSES